MACRERLTIDTTVTRAYLNDEEDLHDAAVELFDLARRGDIELASASSGYAFDARGDLAEQMRAMLERERVVQTTQLAYPGVVFPGPNAFPGAAVAGFREAWDAVAAKWNGPGKLPNNKDALHVETHVLEKRDVFVTDDTGLLTMCRRLSDHGFSILALRLAEYLDTHRQ